MAEGSVLILLIAPGHLAHPASAEFIAQHLKPLHCGKSRTRNFINPKTQDLSLRKSFPVQIAFRMKDWLESQL